VKEMGLSIGVVNVNYLHEPAQPIFDFMSELRSLPRTGLHEYYRDLENRDEDDPLGCEDDDDEYWDDGGFCEFWRIGMIRRATGWAILENLAQSERALLLDWIANLPWSDDYIMLHLGY
jgi:hypothetical protein